MTHKSFQTAFGIYMIVKHFATFLQLSSAVDDIVPDIFDKPEEQSFVKKIMKRTGQATTYLSGVCLAATVANGTLFGTLTTVSSALSGGLITNAALAAGTGAAAVACLPGVAMLIAGTASGLLIKRWRSVSTKQD